MFVRSGERSGTFSPAAMPATSCHVGMPQSSDTMRSSGILLAIVCACAFVVPSLGAARAPPSGFVSLGRAPANSSTFILVAVTQPGAAAAESSCVAVADPDSPKFGQHLTVDEVADVLGARAASERVAAWLRGAGASDVSIVRTGDWVRATVPVYVLEKELRVRMERFSAITATGRVVHAARTLDEMTIPDRVAADIDFFVGVGDFPQLELNTHKTATQRAAARAKVARADGGLDLIGLPVITDTTLYLALVGGCNSSPSPDDDSTCSIFDTPESFTMRITPFSKPSYDVVVPASEAVVGPSGLCFISTTEGILPFTFYNVSVRINCSATSSSAWSDLPFKWDTLPSTYMGVAATPMMTPDYTHDFYGLSEETAGTNTLAHGVVGACLWLLCACGCCVPVAVVCVAVVCVTAVCVWLCGWGERESEKELTIRTCRIRRPVLQQDNAHRLREELPHQARRNHRGRLQPAFTAWTRSANGHRVDDDGGSQCAHLLLGYRYVPVCA